MSTYSQLGLIDSIRRGSEVTLFHDMLISTLLIILSAVCLYANIVYNKKKHRLISTKKNSDIDSFTEILWTVLPLFILASLRLPSLVLLYKLEYMGKIDLSYKVVGHQWYWSYSHERLNDYDIDSYIVQSDDLEKGGFRLLEVDNSLVLPYRTDIRFRVTSEDVIHSFSLPSFFIKVDAMPGRLNAIYIHSDVPRVAYRQCSEICRVNHSFIPISVEFVDWESYLSHVAEQ